MGEVASVLQGVQFGLETTPGTAVAAGKRLQEFVIEPGIKVANKTFRGQGHIFPSLAEVTKEWTEFRWSGPATYASMLYPASSALAKVSPSTPGGATLTRLWTI